MSRPPEPDPSLVPALEWLAERDADLARAYRQIGAPPPRSLPSGFEGMIRIVVGQQVSVAAAAAILKRLEAALVPFLPATILAADDATLRACGLSAQKARYCRALAGAVEKGTLDLPQLKGQDDRTAQQAITALPGFGRWSAEMYLLFALHRPDVWPSGDLAVRAAYQRLKNLPARPSPAELDAHGEAYRPHRSAAARFLWYFYRHPALA